MMAAAMVGSATAIASRRTGWGPSSRSPSSPPRRRDETHDHLGERRPVELQPRQAVEQTELGARAPQGSGERPGVGLALDLVALAEVPHAERCRRPDAGFERLRQALAVAAVG